MSEMECHFWSRKTNKVGTMSEGNTDMTVETTALDWF